MDLDSQSKFPRFGMGMDDSSLKPTIDKCIPTKTFD